VIQVENVTKRYGKHVAVDHLNFNVSQGEILGFLGPNGAGKTTTMNIITGYLSATEGSVRVDGMDVLEQPEEVKRRIGYLPEFPPLYLDMTVDEYLNFVYDLKNIRQANRSKDLDRIMEQVMIREVRERLIKNLSKGYKQRVGLAQAMIGDPPVLILDEPTIGLDPHQIRDIRDLIRELGKKHTILLSSHILPEVSMVCSRVLIISRGRIVASDSPDNLAKRILGVGRLALRVAGPRAAVVEAVSGVKGVRDVKSMEPVEAGTTELIVEADPDTDVRREVFLALARQKQPILMMRSQDITLEEIFLQLTADTRQEA
jgi:ABC-2 type transport system ATP-binding protein